MTGTKYIVITVLHLSKSILSNYAELAGVEVTNVGMWPMTRECKGGGGTLTAA